MTGPQVHLKQPVLGQVEVRFMWERSESGKKRENNMCSGSQVIGPLISNSSYMFFSTARMQIGVVRGTRTETRSKLEGFGSRTRILEFILPALLGSRRF